MAADLRHTICPLDCPDTCLIDVTVSDGRVTRIDGNREDPVTAGFICSKVRGFAQRQYGALRLTHPLRRVGSKGEEGSFERLSWDDAIGEVADRFRAIAGQWGAEAILPYHYGGSNGLLTDGFLDQLFFARLEASRLEKTLCAAPTTAVARAMYGKMPGVAFQDYVHARCIVVWGANPKVSNIHLMPFLKEARRRGAFVAVVDPVRNLSEGEADLHLAVRPGTDLPVALAMIGLWHTWGVLDETFLSTHADGRDALLARSASWSVDRAAAEAGVPAESITKLARELADRSPAVVRCGWGLERNRNGGQAVAAVLALPALLGKFGVRGGGYTMSNSGAARLDTQAVFGPFDWPTRSINQTELGRVLSDGMDPPIKSLFVYNCNPAVTVPDQEAVLRGLGRDDLFTVVFDQVMTDTARYADIVLPATTFLEHHELRVAYGSYVVGQARPVVARPGEAKSNVEVFGLLGRAMGFTDEAFGWTEEEAGRRVLDALVMPGKQPDHADTAAAALRYDFPGETPVMFETAFPLTSDQKIHLTPAVLGAEPFHYEPLESERFPLALVSPATSRTTNSTMGEYAIPELYVEIGAADASRRGVGDGDQVRVFNGLGEVICRARVRDRIRDSVVLMPKGAWLHASPSGRTATVLCPATVSAVGGGACYNDARVEVENYRG
jgi:anaerobic selenocysteine-containing dehydrogenase